MASEDAGGEIGGNIFISYNRNDRDFRTQIEGLLLEEGYNPEFDEEGIESGEAWAHRLEEMIGACDTFLVILTNEWVTSVNCRREFDIAEQKGKRIIPILPYAFAEGEPSNEEETRVRAKLSELNYIHFFPLQSGDGGGFYRGMGKLKRALRDDLEQLRLRRRFEARAEAWRRGEDDLLSGDQLTQAETWMKKESQTTGVAQDIADYIAASQNARTKRERAQKWQRRVLASLIIGLLSAAAIAAYFVKDLRVAEGDVADLLVVSERWAEGKTALLTLKMPGEEENFDTHLTNAIEALETSLETARQIEQDEVRALEFNIGLDLAGAYFNADPSRASTLLSRLSRESFAFGMEDEQALFLMARTLVQCVDGDAQRLLEVRLAEAPEPLRARLNLDTANRWREPHPACLPAAHAICDFDTESRSCADLAPLEDESLEPDFEEPGAPSPAMPRMEPIIEEAPALPYEVYEVFLHISKEEDRADARILAADLSSLGYKVLGIELIEAPDGRNRSVRYYYDQQSGQANRLIQICSEIAADRFPGRAAWADTSTYRTVSLAGRYGKLPENRIEIWL